MSLIRDFNLNKVKSKNMMGANWTIPKNPPVTAINTEAAVWAIRVKINSLMPGLGRCMVKKKIKQLIVKRIGTALIINL